MKWALIFILAVGCATSGKKELALEDITNDDFKKPAPVNYVAKSDYYRGVSMNDAQALQDESLYRLTDYKGSLKSEDAITKIVKSCYEGKYESAFKLVKDEHDRYRNNPAFWNQVGTCYLLQGNKRKALLFYNKALEFAPSYAPALNNIGVMYRRSGEDQKAEVAFARAVESSNFSKTPRFNLAQLYLDYGLFKDAIANFKVLENAKDVDVFAGLGTAYLMAGEHKRAAAYFDKIDKKFLERPYIGINAALAFHKAGDARRARNVMSDIDVKKLGPYKKYYDDSSKKVGL